MRTKKEYFGLGACIAVIVFLYLYRPPETSHHFHKNQGPQRDDDAEVKSRLESFFEETKVTPFGLACNTSPDPGFVRNKKEAVCAFTVRGEDKETLPSKLNIAAEAPVISPQMTEHGLFDPYIPVACEAIFRSQKLAIQKVSRPSDPGLGNSWFFREVYLNREQGLYCIHLGA